MHAVITMTIYESEQRSITPLPQEQPELEMYDNQHTHLGHVAVHLRQQAFSELHA
jgi:hypothetical protein